MSSRKPLTKVTDSIKSNWSPTKTLFKFESSSVNNARELCAKLAPFTIIVPFFYKNSSCRLTGHSIFSFSDIVTITNGWILLNTEDMLASNGSMTTDVVDNGQPCVTCREKCPGYAPQDWKKICANCKCPRMSHEVFIKGQQKKQQFNLCVRGNNLPVTSFSVLLYRLCI